MDFENPRATEDMVTGNGELTNTPSVAQAAAGRGAIVLTADADNVVVLPDGATLQNLEVQGRDLVIRTADGTVYIIPDGAIVVPQLVVEGVSVPPLNLAALLVGNEPQPAAGETQSSGGNFADPVDPIQDAFARGDLLPYTELQFPEPQDEEIIPGLIDEEPDVIVITPDNPVGAVNATASVDEAGLPQRDGEPEGTEEPTDIETTTGTINYNSPDGLGALLINGVEITEVGQTIDGEYGILTITSIADGVVGYSYTLLDNTLGVESDVFVVTVIDTDGDEATADLSISIFDDEPIARNDTDTVDDGEVPTATGNVMTGVGTTSGSAGQDEQGADGASLTAISGVGGSDDVFNASGYLEVQGQYGALQIEADGSYIYTPGPENPGNVSDVFTYTLTDGDGSVATANLTINLPPNIPPEGDNRIDLALDDDALPAGTNAASTDEQVSDTLSFTAGSDALTTFEFGDQASLASLNGPLNWVRVNDTLIEGREGGVGGPAIISLTLTGPAGGSIASGATGTVTVTATLNEAYTLHSLGDDIDTLFNLGTLTVVASESDALLAGETVTGTVALSISDDIPTVTIVDSDGTDDGVMSVVEGSTLNGTWTLEEGADGVDSVTVSTPDETNQVLDVTTGSTDSVVFTLTEGTLTVNADGTWSFVSASGQTQPVSISFTIAGEDADGDATSDALTINITDGAGPEGGDQIALEVDDDALPAGTNAASTDEQVSDTLSFTAGSDALTTFEFGDQASLASLNGPLNWVRVNDTLIEGREGGVGGPAIISLTLTGPAGGSIASGATGTVTVTATLNEAYTLHSLGDDIDTLFNLGTLTVVASESAALLAGETVTGTVALSISDDIPVNFTPVSLTDETNTAPTQDDVLANDGAASATRLLNDSDNNGTGENFMGADGFGALEFTGGTDGDLLTNGVDPITTGGDNIYLAGYGTNTLTAFIESGATAGYQADEDTAVAFTVSLDTGTGNGDDATYTIDFDVALDNGAGVSFENFDDADAGNQNYVGIGADNTNLSVDLLLSSSGAGGADETVNTDSNSIGVQNNSVDNGQTVRIDFVSDLASGGAGPTGFDFTGHIGTQGFLGTIAQVQGSQPQTVAFKVFALDTTFTQAGAPDRSPGNGFSDASTVTITEATVIGYLGGESTPVTVDISAVAVGVVTPVAYGITVMKNADGSVTFSGVQEGDQYGVGTGSNFNAIAVQSQPVGTNGSTQDSFDLGVFSLESIETGDPIDLSFDVLATDEDGDTSTGTIDVTLVPPAAPPIVIDLDGDGAEFASLAAGVAYDYGHGLVATAWAGADDGLLAFDANGDGTVSGASEFVFGGNGLTDLEGLALNYDSNGDGVLNASDAGWAQFGVWQDADLDGVVDAGEFRSLGDLGIAEIQLTSDGEAYTAADGDVAVAGTASVTWADGTTTTLADAAFRTSTNVRQAELATVAAAAGALIVSDTDDTTVQSSPDGTEQQASSDTADSQPASLAAAEAGADAPDVGSTDLLGDGSDGESSQPETTSGTPEDNGETQAALAVVVDDSTDAGASDAGQSDDSAPVMSFADSDTGGLMDALLAMAAEQPASDGAQSTQDLDATKAALAELEGEAAVDALLDTIMDDSGSVTTDQHDAAMTDLAALLDQDVSDLSALFATFETNTVDDDHAALAAASA